MSAGVRIEAVELRRLVDDLTLGYDALPASRIFTDRKSAGALDAVPDAIDWLFNLRF